MKIIWRVAPQPTGRYRSFEKRGWPTAEYETGQYAGSIVCTDGGGYRPREVRAGTHAPLRLRLADYSRPSNGDKGWTAMLSKATYAMVPEAKLALDDLLARFPHFQPRSKDA